MYLIRLEDHEIRMRAQLFTQRRWCVISSISFMMPSVRVCDFNKLIMRGKEAQKKRPYRLFAPLLKFVTPAFGARIFPQRAERFDLKHGGTSSHTKPSATSPGGRGGGAYPYIIFQTVLHLVDLFETGSVRCVCPVCPICDNA